MCNLCAHARTHCGSVVREVRVWWVSLSILITVAMLLCAPPVGGSEMTRSTEWRGHELSTSGRCHAYYRYSLVSSITSGTFVGWCRAVCMCWCMVLRGSHGSA